ncbi:hypothetical protein CCMSSC00406_0001712 [Pleurotus cornucopiae]|uniref:Uncharacterized protein n=1 Tax=Pleurotus cornucopiae TaxID=5321 RepID=A0ACB7IM62_PLECO|nr:hypothetical protein CCMSSC00406_0001712 [Pleurotus cornucopiae]
MDEAHRNTEPLPPFVSQLLSRDSKVKVIRKYPTRRQMTWRHSQLRPSLSQRLLTLNINAYLPDTPSASFYRLYQFLVIDWTVQFRNELEYFWGQTSWALADLPDPDPSVMLEEVSEQPASPSSVEEEWKREAKLRKVVMAGLTRIMEQAYNRLISRGLPRDAPAVVQDWDELKARPRTLERIPKWAEDRAMTPMDPVVEVPDRFGVMPNEKEVPESFASIPTGNQDRDTPAILARTSSSISLVPEPSAGGKEELVRRSTSSKATSASLFALRSVTYHDDSCSEKTIKAPVGEAEDVAASHTNKYFAKLAIYEAAC